MSKMTTEQFLSHLGIEVEQEFMCDGFYCYIDEDGLNVSENIFCLDWLLDKEITPLPKYTLTEDEKAIVRHFGKNFNWLCRDIYGHYLKFDGLDEEYRLPLETDIFHFVSISKPVSLDELRKCL